MGIIAWIKGIVSANRKVRALIILRGVPGAGKTTLAKQLAKKGKYPVIAADDYFTRDGIYTFPKFPDIPKSIEELNQRGASTFTEWAELVKANTEANAALAKEAGHQLYLAHKNCQNRCRAAMANGERLIFVNNTFTKAKDLNPYVKMAIEHGYMVFSVVVENRHGGKNEHGVPEDTIVRMSEELINSIKLR